MVEWKKVFGAISRYCAKHRDEMGLTQQECVKKLTQEYRKDKEELLRKIRPYMRD